jgi:abhydrolase domain-containing protein 6
MILLASTFVICLLITLFAIFYLVPKPFFDFALRAQYRSAGLEKKTIAIDGHEIAYLTGGQGPPLVLLHGFGADKYHWPMVAKLLCAKFTVYAPDLPGFGESTQASNARYTGPDQVSRIREFTESLGLKHIHIGGNSMGGYLAGLYASRYFKDVASLWLLAPAGVLSAEPSELMGLLDQGDNPLLVDDRDSYERLVDMCFTKPPYVPGPFKRCICVESMENREFHAKLFEDLMSDPHPLEEALADSAIPTLITWGDEDRILDPSGAPRLAKVMANAKFDIMERMGHVPMIERPKETAEQFLAFQQSS